MRLFCSPNRIFALFAILIAATALHAQDGWRDAVLRLQPFPGRTGGLLVPPMVTADFNHDGHPDGAVMLRNGSSIQIEVHFRSHQIRRLFFNSSLANLAISVRDVNEDGSPDLVVEEPVWRQPVFAWLNDGTGKFRAASIPDYPPLRETDHPAVTSPLPANESIALTEASNVRIRHTVGYLQRETSIPSLTCFRGPTVRVLDLANTTPNLVRGSPVLHSL